MGSEKAVKLLPVARRLSEEHGFNKIRFRWLEGMVSRGLGELDKAQEHLQRGVAERSGARRAIPSILDMLGIVI